MVKSVGFPEFDLAKIALSFVFFFALYLLCYKEGDHDFA